MTRGHDAGSSSYAKERAQRHVSNPECLRQRDVKLTCSHGLGFRVFLQDLWALAENQVVIAAKLPVRGVESFLAT